ncbi:MAG: hypothetical protein ACRD3O_06630 [Terriglobia bacterium]
MTRRAYIYFVITFVVGIIIGGAGTYYYAWSSGKWRRPWSEDGFIHRMTKDLNLSAPQVKELRSIIDDEITKGKALEAAVRPQFDALHRHGRNEIRHILNPQQLETFDNRVREHQRARKRK